MPNNNYAYFIVEMFNHKSLSDLVLTMNVNRMFTVQNLEFYSLETGKFLKFTNLATGTAPQTASSLIHQLTQFHDKKILVIFEIFHEIFLTGDSEKILKDIINVKIRWNFTCFGQKRCQEKNVKLGIEKCQMMRFFLKERNNIRQLSIRNGTNCIVNLTNVNYDFEFANPQKTQIQIGQNCTTNLLIKNKETNSLTIEYTLQEDIIEYHSDNLSNNFNLKENITKAIDDFLYKKFITWKKQNRIECQLDKYGNGGHAKVSLEFLDWVPEASVGQDLTFNIQVKN